MSTATVPGPPQVAVAFAALDKAVADIGALGLEAMTPAVRLRALERLETAMRVQRATSHDLIADLAKEDPAHIGGRALRQVLADWLRISYAESRRRIRDATQLAPRTTLTGEPMPAQLEATAHAWHRGVLDPDHLRVIQDFMHGLPQTIPVPTVEEAERFLAAKAADVRPDQLAKVAHRYAQRINPDGTFTDADRARQRGFSWSTQRHDGISTGRLTATPELRANLDAWMARFAAPGMCNPDDQTPRVTGQPTDDAHNTDLRTPAQRQHDALNALVRGQLGDPKLGVHHGLPVTVIVSTTLKELTAGTGTAVTAGGTLLPMRDVIRMASHAYHYLAVFDDHQNRPLYLGRTRRIASPDQWIVLYARDRGCTHPGCDVPGYHTQAHHIRDWSRGGHTDIDELTLACGPDHKLIDKGWRTIKRKDGQIEWVPPPELGLPGATNTFHHPEHHQPNGPPDNAAA